MTRKIDLLENFSKWSSKHGYSADLSIDRIDNSKGYSPDNCRWVDMKTQQNNRTNNHIIKIDGVCKTMKQWSDFSKIPYWKIQRISYRQGDESVAEVIKNASD